MYDQKCNLQTECESIESIIDNKLNLVKKNYLLKKPDLKTRGVKIGFHKCRGTQLSFWISVIILFVVSHLILNSACRIFLYWKYHVYVHEQLFAFLPILPNSNTIITKEEKKTYVVNPLKDI